MRGLSEERPLWFEKSASFAVRRSPFAVRRLPTDGQTTNNNVNGFGWLVGWLVG